MFLARTIFRLDIGDVPPDEALSLAQLGYMQWLGGLPGQSNYRDEAKRALAASAPFKGTSPAVAMFCDLVERSTARPVSVIDIKVCKLGRRGGAQARRQTL